MLRMKEFYGAKRHASVFDQSAVLGPSILDLLTYLEQLPDNPTTLGIVVLSSYATWSKRAMYWDGGKPFSRARPKPQRADDMTLDDDVLGEDEEELLDADEVNRVHLYYPGIFARIIADEAQKLKSIAAVAHRSVLDLAARHYILLTATPMINRPMDLVGLLALFWKQD